MSGKSWRVGVAGTLTVFAMLAVCAAGLGTAAAAQAPPNAPDPGAIEANPIACWWRTDKSAVHIGERFTLTLTCRAAETSAVTAAPTESEIEPTSIQLTPFDVLAGTRHEDIVASPWRYFQYVYTVRLLGDEFFGQDVNIPATNLTYRIRSGGAEGVEHTYILPSMPMRIISLLPAVAHTLPVGAVLQGCLNELERVKAAVALEGWNPDLVARALAPFRIAGAIALSQPVAHQVVDVETRTREGQIALRQGIVRRRHALVFAPITAGAIDRLRTAGNGHPETAATRDGLDRIRESL